ncbi:MAG TPA: DUF1622 domain-containing protein [Bryobacteraceae bacterium]|nr:DUF1622 domain-containing protein [Bryobacteraceae bacterium]
MSLLNLIWNVRQAGHAVSLPGRPPARAGRSKMLEQSKLWIEYLAIAVEVAAAVVIGLASLEAIMRALPLFVRRDVPQQAKVDIRLGLGRWLALGLEFALAADILRTAVAPSWREIGQLAAIAVLRTALNFFLEREIEREEGRSPEAVGKAHSA